ncbi:MAG: Ig-like domain repeat protein, partial [Actinobacteria bacterium]|nr:Ig-like domain repeat protein [Actinomycetota bacterium]
MRRALILSAAAVAVALLALGGGASGASAQSLSSVTTTTAVPLSLPLSPVNQGTSVTFSTTVTASSGTASPTGTVTFFSNFGGLEVAIGSGTLAPSGSGQSTASLTTNALSVGTYAITAQYVPDNIFAFLGSSSQGGLTFVVQSTLVTTTMHFSAQPITTTAGQYITFTANVTASDGSIPVGNVAFSAGPDLSETDQVPLYGLQSHTGVVPLDATGTAQITASFPAGTFYVVAGYPGNGNVSGVSGYLVIVVNPLITQTHPSSLHYNGATSAVHGSAATLSASLTDTNGGAVGLEPVTLSMGSESCQATTDTFGMASCQITVGDAPGNYTVTATFPGNNVWSASSDSAPFVVLPLRTSLTANQGAGATGFQSTLSATLTDGSGNPLAGQTVTLSLPDESCSATTDSHGNASCPVTVLETPGPYTLTASFAGAGNYAAATGTAPFTVSSRNSATTVNSATVSYGSPLTLTTTLTDGVGNPLANETVSLAAGSQSCVAPPTGANGQTSCTIPSVTQLAATYPITATFTGDGFYGASNGTGTLTVLALPTSITYTGATTGAPGTTIPVSAHLVDQNGHALANKTVTITENG